MSVLMTRASSTNDASATRFDIDGVAVHGFRRLPLENPDYLVASGSVRL
jgi:hypothetical protein